MQNVRHSREGTWLSFTEEGAERVAASSVSHAHRSHRLGSQHAHIQWLMHKEWRASPWTMGHVRVDTQLGILRKHCYHAGEVVVGQDVQVQLLKVGSIHQFFLTSPKSLTPSVLCLDRALHVFMSFVHFH